LPRRFSLLIVRGDGSRVLRMSVPCWALRTTLGGATLALVLVAISLGVFSTDYLSLRQQRQSLAVLLPGVTEQQALVALYQQRVREVRAEMDGWHELHEKIWEPFGPEAGPAKRTSGIGGGTSSSFFEAPPDRGDVRDELSRLISTVREEGENLRSLERFLSRASKVLASLPSRWPLRGPVNSDFGKRLSPWAPNSEFHSGMDIGVPIGTPLHAPAPGAVVFAGRHPEYGITVIIDHGNDTKSLYGHLSRLNVATDEKVGRGQMIALSGNTGRSSGPHLHYEIQVKGQPVNPHSYLWN
jgi:murein DD-endopeptidase MepM/ murein hydrolase activator NlpD